MTTRRRSWTVSSSLAAAWLVAACACAQTPGSFPVYESCGGSATVANVQASDAVKVHYRMSAGSGPCYAVTVTVSGNRIEGFLRGTDHPAIAAFDQDVRLHAAVIPDPPPPPPEPRKPATNASPATAVAAKPAPAESPSAEPPAPAAPVSFAGFRAVDINGRRVDLNAMHARNVVVYFWSARDRRSIKNADQMELVYDEFHPLGLDVVGIASAANASQLRQVSRDNEVVWPQVLDSGGIASRYHVNPANPYLLLDQSRKVIAAVSSPAQLPPLLGPLTKNRRSR